MTALCVHTPLYIEDIHIPSTYVDSCSPGHLGIVMQINLSGSIPTLRYWKAVPTGMSTETPGTKAVTRSCS